MTAVKKTATLGALGLPEGDHWVKFHVTQDSISLEVAATQPKGTKATAKQTGSFVEKWGGTARKVEDASDERLAAINEKHLRD